MTLRIFCIPTLTRCISINAVAEHYTEGHYRNVGNEGFFVRGDPLKKKHDTHLREYGTQEIKSGVMLVCDTDIENALRLFFTHRGTKTGVAGKESSRALKINDTLPIVELAPLCPFLTGTLPRMAQTLHDGLCQAHADAVATCPTERALRIVLEMNRDDWGTFVSENVSIGGRGGQRLLFISAENLSDNPLFAERMQQKQTQYAST